jgi:superfamily I DNA/RNA helicase
MLTEPTPDAPAGQLRWVAEDFDVPQLQAHGVTVFEFADVRAAWDGLQASRTAVRTSLDDPAAGILRPLRAATAVAVAHVRLGDVEDLRCLHHLVLRPVLHAGRPLLVQCAERLEHLKDAAFTEPWYEHPYTLERARWLVTRALTQSAAVEQDGDPSTVTGLDAEQARAATAGGGVLQVIAPAGSGKTTTLIARTGQLIERGIRPERILLVTFNAAAAGDLNERLAAQGLGQLARTFHSVGRSLLKDHFDARELAPSLTPPQWQRLAREAQKAAGTAVDVEPTELPALIADLKLGRLLTPDEALAQPALTDQARVVAHAYAMLEDERARRGQTDFDDMIFLPVRRLRTDAEFRHQAQELYDAVLVDEYQDIEPAQLLLVTILAAPRDELTVVGDADQVLYGWRRAAVETIVTFDAGFPGLRRVALATNYRCAPEAVAGAARLIAHNKARFPLTISPAPGRPAGGQRAVRVVPVEEGQAAGLLARKLHGHTRAQIAVLGRTVNTLRPYAYAAASAGIKLDGPDQLFDSSGALRTIEAYMAVFADPAHAREDDVGIILRRPGRGLGDERYVTAYHAALHAGADPVRAVDALPVNQVWRKDRLAASMAALMRLRSDATAFIKTLRRDGLDDYYDQHAAGALSADASDRDVLDRCQADAAGQTVAVYNAQLEQWALALRNARSKTDGIEMTTIHRAKGRQWPRVVVVGVDEGILPHKASLLEDPTGEGEEGERRVAYVAMTRAVDELSLLYTSGKHSRFLHEAGYVPEPAQRWKPAATQTAGVGFWDALKVKGTLERPPAR